MSYLLYFPGSGGPLADRLTPCGLETLARDRQPEAAPIDRGPDGGPGTLVTWRTGNAQRDPPLAILPSQDWQPCRPVKGTLKKGAYWVGLDRQKKLQPADIERQILRPGYWLELADKQRWHIPVAAQLPHRHGINDDGDYERSIDPAFEAFWERSRSYAQILLTACGQLELARRLHGDKAPASTTVDFPLHESYGHVVAALAINYRLNGELVSRLKLIDDDALTDILKATANLPVLLEVREEKKKESVSIPIG